MDSRGWMITAVIALWIVAQASIVKEDRNVRELMAPLLPSIVVVTWRERLECVAVLALGAAAALFAIRECLVAIWWMMGEPL